MSEYIGNRIVPKHDGVWNSAKSYEPLVIVYEEGSGDSYISRKNVPAGTALSNEDCWALCARFSEQMELYQENLDTAVADMQQSVEDAEKLTNSNRNTLNSRMDTLESRLDANVAASTDADADYAAEVVDARVDSEGETSDSLGENIRSITSGLTLKIKPSTTGVAALAAYGNSASIGLEGRTVKAAYSHTGVSYVGLFAGFFGTYADVADKKIRIVMWSDIENSFEAIITNAPTAWGSDDRSVTAIGIGRVYFTEENHYRASIDIDFSLERYANFAAGLAEGRRTLYFCLRKESENECSGTMYFYAYELDGQRDMLWKYVTLYDDILLLEDEIRNARNDGTEYSTLQEILLAHRADIDAIAGEIEDARTDSEGTAYDTLGEAVRSCTSGLIPKITPISIGKVAASGNSVTIAKNGKLVEGQFTHSGSSYIGLFANFFGTYENVKGRKITYVLHSDIAITFSALLTNASTAWGSTDGSVGSITLGNVSFKKENGYTVSVEVDFTNESVLNWASAKTGSLYFCLRYQSTTAVESCNITMYAYYSDELSGLDWKYAPWAQNADHAWIADEADHAAEADTASEADFAANAGYSKRDAYGLVKAGNCAISSLKNDGNAVTVIYSPISTDSPNMTTYLWNYWLVTFNILDLFGKGVKFYISGTNTGGAFGPAFYRITETAGNWSSTVKSVSVGKTTAEKFSFCVDLDSLGIDPSEHSALYLLIGYDGKVSSADEDGNYVSNYQGQIDFKVVYTDDDHTVIASELAGFDPDDYYDSDEVDEKIAEAQGEPDVLSSIVCWGDSLTAGGGWTTTLQTLSGLTVYNGGTGGENARTIMARQGGDVMLINNITIPAECEAVTLATRAEDGGITTQFGNKVTPLLQGGAHVNPVMIGDIEGTLKWTGSNYADTTGTWTFTRSEAGEAVEITRPTAIRTNFDRIHNGKDTIMIIFMGQNGGYSDIDDLINMHRLMIDHFKGKEYLILGLSSGTASSRADYEEAMQEAFGRRFLSLREYLSTALYDEDGNIISCYGLDDQDLEMEETHTYGGTTYVTLDEIAAGTVPHQILADGVHYTSGTMTVIGNLIYKRLVELGIL